MNNVHYLAAVYPHLQWSADIGSDHEETDRLLSGLDGLFRAEELNLCGGEPREGSLLSRLATCEFWVDGRASAPVNYSHAERFYLENCLAMDGFSAFEEYLGVWARVFYTVRLDVRSRRDVLLLFLQQNLDYLKDLFVLSQERNRDIAANWKAVQACTSEAESGKLISRPQFPAWVLNDWLPLHLRKYHRASE